MQSNSTDAVNVFCGVVCTPSEHRAASEELVLVVSFPWPIQLPRKRNKEFFAARRLPGGAGQEGAELLKQVGQQLVMAGASPALHAPTMTGSLAVIGATSCSWLTAVVAVVKLVANWLRKNPCSSSYTMRRAE